jgi:hypothetical protein
MEMHVRQCRTMLLSIATALLLTGCATGTSHTFGAAAPGPPAQRLVESPTSQSSDDARGGIFASALIGDDTALVVGPDGDMRELWGYSVTASHDCSAYVYVHESGIFHQPAGAEPSLVLDPAALADEVTWFTFGGWVDDGAALLVRVFLEDQTAESLIVPIDGSGAVRAEDLDDVTWMEPAPSGTLDALVRQPDIDSVTGWIEIRDRTSDESVARLTLPDGVLPSSIGWLPDGTLLAGASTPQGASQPEIRRIDPATGQFLDIIELTANSATRPTFAISPDGTEIAFVDRDDLEWPDHRLVIQRLSDGTAESMQLPLGNRQAVTGWC